MARRGRFGRIPRAAPSLTNTIIAIAREMQNQRDSNLMDAWKAGGLFEGAPATDAMVLDHWKKRMTQVDKDDPLYDTYQNAYMQLDYSIHESKISTLYAQGKIGEAQVGAFYLNWAKKVPKDSEFYRVLQRDGAQFLRSAKAKSDAAAKKAKEEAYVAKMNGMRDKDQLTGEYLMQVMSGMAAAGNPALGIPGLVGPEGDLRQFDSSDPAQMLRMIGLLKIQGPAVLYHDEKGKAVTSLDVAAKLKELDPRFGGVVSLDYVQSQLARQKTSLIEQKEYATETGHASDADDVQKTLDYVSTVGRQVNAWPLAQDYMELRAAYDAAGANMNLSPVALMGEWEKYQGGLRKLADDPSIATDDRLRSSLLAEANMTVGGTTLAEDFTGARGGDASGGDVAVNKANIEYLQDMIDDVASEAAVWTQGEYTKGVFTPTVGGSAIGAATVEQIVALSPNGDPKVMFVPSGDGRSSTTMVVASLDVTVVAYDPVTGKKLETVGRNDPVAQLMRVSYNGVMVETWAYERDGKTVYSSEPPGGDRVKVVQGVSGPILDISNTMPADKTGMAGGSMGDGWFIGGKTFQGIKDTGEIKPGNPGVVQFDPATALWAADKIHQAAGSDPFTEFASPSLAGLRNPAVADGRKELVRLAKDPKFLMQVDWENRLASGQRYDETAGRWSGGDLVAYQRSAQQTGLVIAEETFGIPMQALWDRLRTTAPTEVRAADVSGAAPLPAQGETAFGIPGGLSLGAAGDRTRRALPSDSLAGTQMGALGGAFVPGTNNLKGPAIPVTGVSINLGPTLKVPGLPDSGLTPRPMLGPPAPTPSPMLGPPAPASRPTEPTPLVARWKPIAL